MDIPLKIKIRFRVEIQVQIARRRAPFLCKNLPILPKRSAHAHQLRKFRLFRHGEIWARNWREEITTLANPQKRHKCGLVTEVGFYWRQNATTWLLFPRTRALMYNLRMSKRFLLALLALAA